MCKISSVFLQIADVDQSQKWAVSLNPQARAVLDVARLETQMERRNLKQKDFGRASRWRLLVGSAQWNDCKQLKSS